MFGYNECLGRDHDQNKTIYCLIMKFFSLVNNFVRKLKQKIALSS